MIVRALTAEDADELAALLAENREWLAPHEPVRDERFFTPDGQRERIESEGSHGFAILADDHIAGIATISNIVRGSFQSGSLGYWIAEPFTGRGLTTRAVSAVVAIAFSDLSLHRLEAATLVDNVPSQRVLEKNGFELIGLARRYLENRRRVVRSPALPANGGLITDPHGPELSGDALPRALRC